MPPPSALYADRYRDFLLMWSSGSQVQQAMDHARATLAIFPDEPAAIRIMGLVNIAAMISTYFIANRYTEEPEIVAIIVIIVTAVIFVSAHTITQGFDKLAQANKMKTEFVSIAAHQ